MSRTCKNCGQEKPDNCFYKSITTHCRACWRERVKFNRRERIEQYRAYDRRRANNPERVAARAEYARSEQGRKSSYAAKRKYSNRPDRAPAHSAVQSAIRSGDLERMPCIVCGEEKVQAHHFDYQKPLDVIWLCVHHHSAYHKVEREVQRRESAS